MKKIISIIGLSTLLTISNLLASDSIITDPLAEEALTIESRFKGFYIKPFLGGWWLSGKQSNEISSTEVSVPVIKTSDKIGVVSSASCKMQTKVNSIFGITVGKHLNKYIGIESSIGYYHSNDFRFVLAQRVTSTKIDRYRMLSYNVDTNYLGIINVILSPTVNASITEKISLYISAGIGASYIMFSNNINDWDTNYTQKLLSRFEAESIGGDSGEVEHYNNAQKFHLSWAVGAGVRIHLTESTELDIGYSYKSLGKLPTSSFYQAVAKKAGVSVVESIPLLVHEVRIGIKFNF